MACAYDAIAATYDAQVAGDQWMRDILWSHYRRVFQPGQHVLDVCCGSGLDAVFLARAGIAVTAVDVSPEMIARCRERVAAEGLPCPVDTQVLDAADLTRLQECGAAPFDGIISAFAGLSTVADLDAFAHDAAGLMRPGAHLIVHLLNRWSLWEWLWLLSQRQWARARRLGDQSQRVFLIGGQPVRHNLYYPYEAYERHFAAHFALRECYGLGVLRPPHTLAVPAPFVALLGGTERLLGAHQPCRDRGRFFVLDMICRVEPRP